MKKDRYLAWFWLLVGIALGLAGTIVFVWVGYWMSVLVEALR